MVGRAAAGMGCACCWWLGLCLFGSRGAGCGFGCFMGCAASALLFPFNIFGALFFGGV